jgi:hypothetical protein
MIIISVYLPAVGSKNHQVEYHECIDELYEIYQKYSNSHDIILGGDINEDLNNYKPNNPRKDYLNKFIHELNLQYENRGNTFTNSKGCECSELDYFIYNIDSKKILDKKSVLRIDTNPSDHLPIRMTIKWNYHKINNTDNTTIRGKTKWDKVDKNLYKAIIGDKITKLKQKFADNKVNSEEVVSQLNSILTTAADQSSNKKAIYQAKLKMWNNEINTALKEKRQSYNMWIENSKLMNLSNPLLIQKKRTKQEFRRSIRIAVAKLHGCEKEAIMEARSNNMEMFHKLIQRNRKKGNECIQDLNVNSITYSGQNEVIQGFKEHFSKLATLEKKQFHGNKYHQLVEKEIVYINEMTKNQPIQPITEKELKDAINSINRRKSEDYYNITIEHFLYSEDKDYIHTFVTNQQHI